VKFNALLSAVIGPLVLSLLFGCGGKGDWQPYAAPSDASARVFVHNAMTAEYDIFVDDLHVGKVMPGASLSFAVAPGEHELKAYRDNRSTSTRIKLAPGETSVYTITTFD
jgi:hypothetical protein